MKNVQDDEQIYKEAVGVFQTREELDEAIAELEASAFARHDINVLGSKSKLERRFGTAELPPRLLRNNPDVPKDAAIHPEERAIASGAIVGVPAYLAGCAAGVLVNPASNLLLIGAVSLGSAVGAVIGGCILYGVKAYMDLRTQKQIGQGGLILWVKTFKPEQETKAKKILETHGAQNIHFNAVPA